MLLFFFFFFWFSLQKHNVVCTNLNSDWYQQHMPFSEVDRKYTSCNLKAMELLDYALIGVCAVISLIKYYVDIPSYLDMFFSLARCFQQVLSP